ncbi:MAG: 30S ribosomal protein S11 [Deltaproteobacteria bacterium]|nr:30S ribosomal protein S11 [Deltaproteobacteria bacterium]
MAKPRGRTGKSRVKKNVPSGIAYILATFNNTKVSFTDPQGNVIAWSNAGVVGFKGSRKSTPFAARQTAEDAAKKAMDHGMRSVDIHVKGPGSGRESAIRAIQSVGMTINVIRDITPIPHNGCRPPKRRRV